MRQQGNQSDQQKDIYHQNSLIPPIIHIKEYKIYNKPVKVQTLYPPIQWSLFFKMKAFLSDGTNYYATQKQNSINILCFHGAGHSSLVFGQLAKLIKTSSTLITYDLIGHGDTQSQQQFTIQNFVKQGIYVYQQMEKKFQGKFIFVGHSLGGSIATRVAQKLNNQNIIGVVMIDTIEGMALKSQRQMIQFLTERPQQFISISSAIHWHINAGCLRRRESARFSVPSQIIKRGEKYTWKVDLLKTKKYWHDWFKGCSQKFIDLQCRKLLLTTSKFRLDQILLNGLKQNKISLWLFDHSGHSIQEDQYEKVCRILISEFIQEKLILNVKFNLNRGIFPVIQETNQKFEFQQTSKNICINNQVVKQVCPKSFYEQFYQNPVMSFYS